MALLSHSPSRGACPVCGGRCKAFPDVDHLDSYPFLPGGRDPLAGKRWIVAPHRIVDPVRERVVYGTGERVPYEDAVKYGLIEADAPTDEPTKPTPRPKGKRRPAEDRARKPDEDR